MIVEAKVVIRGSREAVWAAVTDIENAASFTRGIEAIEVVEKPARGLVGLRWKETRILFGDPATVEKRITHAVERESCRTRAESDGFVFLTTVTLAEGPDGVTVTSAHETVPQGFAARLKALPMILFKGVIRKAIRQDLDDLRAVVEKG